MLFKKCEKRTEGLLRSEWNSSTAAHTSACLSHVLYECVGFVLPWVCFGRTQSSRAPVWGNVGCDGRLTHRPCESLKFPPTLFPCCRTFSVQYCVEICVRAAFHVELIQLDVSPKVFALTCEHSVETTGTIDSHCHDNCHVQQQEVMWAGCWDFQCFLQERCLCHVTLPVLSGLFQTLSLYTYVLVWLYCRIMLCAWTHLEQSFKLHETQYLPVACQSWFLSTMIRLLNEWEWCFKKIDGRCWWKKVLVAVTGLNYMTWSELMFFIWQPLLDLTLEHQTVRTERMNTCRK